MKSALIEPNGRVAQVVNDGAQFPVHPDFKWVPVEDGVAQDDKIADTKVALITLVSVEKASFKVMAPAPVEKMKVL